MNQVRPGLALGLEIDGERVEFLAVHLKSSCVSPFEDSGQLAGTPDACKLLQKQVVPLESWIEAKSAITKNFIVLGDFNRNLWH